MHAIQREGGECFRAALQDGAPRAVESKWDPIRQKLVRRLLEEQDKVLRSYFARKGGASKGVHGKGREHVKWDMYA